MSDEDNCSVRIGVQLFELPKATVSAITELLDYEDTWHQLGELVALRASEVTLIDQSASTRGVSPSGEFLRVLAAQGYTADHLYGFLAKMRLVRAQKMIEEYVHKEYKDFFNPEHYQDHLSSEENTPVQNVTQTNGSENETACGNSKAESSQRTETNDQLQMTLSSTLAVPYEELRVATEDFDAKYILGRGGYGVVYKAEWQHSTVAVKRITNERMTAGGKAASSAGERERWRQSLVEMRALALYRHDHILPLYGYALDGPEPLLIYQFMAGGSFEDRLQRRNNQAALNWPQRVAIVLGTALALHYLHAQRPQPLIHGDVKTGNILLDAHLTPRLGDFGLSRYGHMHLPSGALPLIASHVKGTLAYLPPEFLCRRQLSAKLDAYSLGVVLMEAATGKRAYTADRQPESLAAYLLAAVNDNGLPDVAATTADRSAGDGDKEPDLSTAQVLLETGVRCCAHLPENRPDMAELVGLLRQLRSECAQ